MAFVYQMVSPAMVAGWEFWNSDILCLSPLGICKVLRVPRSHIDILHTDEYLMATKVPSEYLAQCPTICWEVLLQLISGNTLIALLHCHASRVMHLLLPYGAAGSLFSNCPSISGD